MDSRNRALCDMQVWPTAQKMDWRAWLSNFPDSDLPYARCLLEAFIYLSAGAIDALFISGFRALSQSFAPFDDHSRVRDQWRRFLNDVIVVVVEGETPSPTDSAHLFARRARDLAGIPADRILTPFAALRAVAVGFPRPLVFVDDFVGSGNQFVETWRRVHDLGDGSSLSFADLAQSGRNTFFYIPLVATKYGLARIDYDCPPIRVLPVHSLGNEYSAVHPESLLWRPDLRAGAIAFLERSCTTAGLDYHACLGFHQLALSIGFEHSVPDATLKLFSHSSASWHPLIRY